MTKQELKKLIRRSFSKEDNISKKEIEEFTKHHSHTLGFFCECVRKSPTKIILMAITWGRTEEGDCIDIILEPQILSSSRHYYTANELISQLNIVNKKKDDLQHTRIKI